MKRGLRRLDEVMADLLARQGYGDSLSAREREAAWRESIASPLLEFTTLGGLRRGVLEVLVHDAVVLQELSFAKESLVRQLQERLPNHDIRDLRFRIGS